MRLLPVMSALAITALLAAACGNSIYSGVGSSPAATTTSTPGTGKFLYAGNHSAGTISEYQRSSSNGALTSIGSAASGVKKGPVGITTNPNGKFLYVANPGDGLHQFAINQSSGALTSLTGNDGLVAAGDAPQWVAISSGGSGTFAYAPNFNDGSVSQYVVASDGKLQSNGVAASGLLKNPFGAVATSSFLYVSDHGNGTIVSFPINSDGTLATSTASAVDSSSQAARTPVVVILTLDGKFLYASDNTTGFVSVFPAGGSALSSLIQSVQSAASGAVGLALASMSNGNEFLYVANQKANSISRYAVNSSTGILTAAGVVTGSLAFPTGLVVGITGSASFLYVANQTGRSIVKYTINAVNGALSNPASVATGSAPQFLAIPAG